MAKRGLKRGRRLVTGGLMAFVLVAAAVIARRSHGHREGLAVTALERRKAELESQRVKLNSRIRLGSAASVILPIAEQRLGMHLPLESQMVVLGRPTETDGAP